ncbi:ABC transporter permease family protein [Helicovermis profundi]|uniref:ABC transmembrane type-1 domain-containing protein n=1 Tax=Helicovermis profundi TaxID=3065157 RepID=A0AAU9EIV9_9FIRM|nr:hypothetical protein HLPR_18540 [Clostridia bacterium S502]
MKKQNIIFIIIITILSLPVFSSLTYVLLTSHSSWSIFSYRRFLIIIKTLVYGFSVSTITCIIGALIALQILKKYKKTKIISFAILSLMGIPPYFYSYIALSISKSIFNVPFLSGFLISTGLQSLYLLPLSISVWLFFINSIPNVYFEDLLLIVNKKKAYFEVLINLMINPGKILLVLLTLITINDYTIPSIFAYNTYPIEIMSIFAAKSSLQAPLIVSFPMIIISLLLVTYIFKTWNTVDVDFSNQSNILFKHTKKHSIISNLFLFSIIGIILIVIIYSNISQASNFYFNSSIVGDLVFGHSSAIIAAFISSLLAYYFNYKIIRNVFFRKLLVFLIILFFSLPGTLTGLMINSLYQGIDLLLNTSLYNTILPIVHMLTIRFLAVAFLIIWIGISNIHSSIIDIAILNTSSSYKIMYKVIWPYVKYYVLSNFFIVTILMIGELPGSIMVVPPGKSTITITIYNYLHYGSSDMVALLIIIMIFALILFFSFLIIILNHIDKTKDNL